MSIRPDLLQELVDTFKVELSENLQVITDGLLALEKHHSDAPTKKIIEEIFRAGHNIKGSSSSIGISDVSAIAHHIESIFASIRDNKLKISLELINTCLEAVDGMHEAMRCFIDKTGLPFDLEDLTSRLAIGGNVSADTKAKTTGPSNRKTEKLRESEPAQSIQQIQQTTQDQQSKSQTTSTANTPTLQVSENDTIRVALPQLDKVTTLMEELQLNKIAIDEHYNDLVNLATKVKSLSHHSFNEDLIIDIKNIINQMRKNMANNINDLSSTSNSLQDQLRTLRLIPASKLTSTLKRTVRDLGNTLNKKVELEILGDDIKMDKLILESLKDPITHILRNAIDHGIETSDTRKANNKPHTAKIILNIIDEGDQIYLTISDDGGGIDYKKVAAIAEKKKLLPKTELEKLSEEEIINLIFHPGFSTKEIITDISGRGVGLDVVKTNLNNIKGDVTVSTKIHHGTVFQLRFPLTLSGDVGLIVKSSNQTFIVPTSTVERVLMIHKKDVITVQGTQAIVIDDKPIPLRRLSDILKIENLSNTTNGQLQIVIIKKSHATVALMVEEIIGKREIVIKPLSPPLSSVSCVSGGTLLGNGQVVIVLNISDVINVAMNLTQSGLVIDDITEDETPKQQHHILLVDDSITTRTLGKNILENNNYKVTVAVDGAQAWDLLHKQTFSLMMTDVEMPNMTGLELTQKVKESEKLHDLPVIIVTSLGTDAQKQRGIEVGADAYIVKHDFESKALLAIIEQLV